MTDDRTGVSKSGPALSAPDDAGPAVTLNRATVLVIFAALMVAMFLSSLDQSVVSTALPTIVGDLGAVDHEGWIVTAYLLTIAISMPVYGKLGDMYGRRWPFLIAITIFVIGSTGSALSGSFAELVTWRALQGLGAGGLMITSQAIIADIVSARERGKFMGPIGAIFGIAAVAGPLLGGWFTEGPGWRWSFWLNVPIGIIALVVAWFALRLPSRRNTRPFDVWGTILLTIFTSGVVLVTSWASIAPSGHYDWSSPWLLGLLIITIVAFGLFIWVETRAPEPLVPLHLFRDRVFSVSVSIAFVLGITMFAALSYLPTFLQMARGLGPTSSGLHMLPMTIGLMITSIGSGLLISKTGKYRIYPILGMAITTAGIVWLTRISGNMSILLFGAMTFVLGFGLGLVMQTIVIAVQNAVAASQVGTATSTNNFLREIGAAIGTSLFGALFTSKLAANLKPIFEGADAAHLPHGFSSADLTPDMMKKLPADIQSEVINAYAQAMAPTFWYLAPIAAIGFVLTLFLRNRRLSTEAGLVARGEVPAEGQDGESDGQATDAKGQTVKAGGVAETEGSPSHG